MRVATASLVDMIHRVRAMRHADSTLVPLSDGEFEAGMAASEMAAVSGGHARTVGLDLLVLR